MGAIHSKEQQIKTGTIRTQLVRWFLFLALVPILLVSVFTYQNARDSLEEAAKSQLRDASVAREAYLKNWFDYRYMDLGRQAESTSNLELVVNLAMGLKASGADSVSFVSSDAYQKLMAENDFGLVKLKAAYDYIYDIFLIDADGNVLFSVAEESDFGTNMISGPYSHTGFAKVVRASLTNKKTLFSGFERYAPSAGMLSGFISAPLINTSGQVEGVIAIQIRLDRIQGSFERANHGHIKQYIVSENQLLRESEGHIQEIQRRQVVGEESEFWRRGEFSELVKKSALRADIHEYIGLDGDPVFGMAKPVLIWNVQWLLITEAKKAEALKNAEKLAALMSMIVAFTTVFVIFVAGALATKITRPLQELSRVVSKVGQGVLEEFTPIDANNEIGQLSFAFSKMITARKNYEKNLLEVTRKAEGASRAKSEFLACMSHEIRTPMNGVLGMLGMLLQTKLDKSQQRHLAVAQSSAQSLLELINDILDYSKIEAGQLDIESIEYAIDSLLVDILHSMSLRAEEKGLELILDANTVAGMKVSGDPSRLRQILVNLIGNAIKFTEAGQIVVSAVLSYTDDNEPKLTCSVKDTGMGISYEQQERLFESFTQLDASNTRQYGGTGLGLAICKQLSQLMGGDIWVESKIGHGSCFNFSSILQHAEHEDEYLPDIDMSGIRVLVVDDVEVNREIFRSQLERWGVNVDEADSAASALQKTAIMGSNTYDVILVDFQMPHMDGVSFGEELTRRREMKSTKLILMSSAGHANSLGDLNEKGFSGCLVKPVAPVDLHAAMSIVLSPSDQKDETHLVTKSYIDSLARHDRQAGTSLETTRISNGRVLIVEDNPINQEVIELMVGGFGYQCDIAENGARAVSLLRASGSTYALVFMDCQMPVMDGFQATKAIREGGAGEANNDIPIVALTANAMKGDREKCLTAGMTDYISKPIDPDLVEAVLAKFVRSQAKNYRPIVSEVNAEPASAPELFIPKGLLTIDFGVKKPDIAKKASAYIRVLTTYLKHNSEWVTNAKKVEGELGFNALKELAHAIKGASGNLGMMPVFDLAREIEEGVIETSTVDKEKLVDLYSMVTASLSDAQAIIDANKIENNQVDCRAFVEVKQDVISKCEAGAMVSETLVKEFELSAKSILNQVDITMVVDGLGNFDYEEVVEFLQGCE